MAGSLTRRLGGVGTPPGPPFDPATLFAGTQGGFWDVSDSSTLTKDRPPEGTYPTLVTADNDPIGRITDKSGNGNHLLYDTPNSGKRPLYKTNSGLPYALFDGTDDFLRATFTFGTTWERISAIQVVSFNALINEQYYGDVIANECVFGSGSNLTMFNGVATGGVQATSAGTDIVLTELWSNPMQLRIDNGSFNSVANAAVNPGGITMGGKFNNGDNANMRVYACFMINRALTSTERANVVTFMGSKQGRSL